MSRSGSGRQPEFRRIAGGLKEGGSLGAEFVALDVDSGAVVGGAHDAAENHELHRAVIVEQSRPAYGQLDRHAHRQGGVRGEPHATTRYIHGLSRPGFRDMLSVEQLIACIALDPKAFLTAPLTRAAERYNLTISCLFN